MLALNKVLFLLIVFGQICEIVSGIKRCSDGAYRGYNVPCPQLTTTTTAKPPIAWHLPECPQRNATLFYTGQLFSLSAETSTIVGRIKMGASTRWISSLGGIPGHSTIKTLAFDYKRQALLLSTKRYPNQIYSMDLEGKVELLAKHKAGHFEQIAVDAVTGNVYFAEKGLGIGVCNHEITKCDLIVKANSHKQQYRNLIVHSRRGAMLWIENVVGNAGATEIKIAGMNGKEQRQLIPSIADAKSIALDDEAEMLYIARSNTVDRLNLRSIEHLEFASIQTTSIYYFNCHLFYVERHFLKAQMFSDLVRIYYTQENRTEIMSTSTNSGHFALAIDDKRFDQHNPCLELDCNEICVLAEGTGKPDARCIFGETMYAVSQEASTNASNGLSAGWIVALILMILIILTTIIGLLLYFQVVPSLNQRFGIRATTREQAPDSINVVYNSKTSSISS